MMSTPSSAAIIAARDDEDLKNRARALAATVGMTASEVDAEWASIVVRPVDSSGGASIASVFEYARGQYEKKIAAMPAPPARPGEDMTYVRDAQIVYALTHTNA